MPHLLPRHVLLSTLAAAVWCVPAWAADAHPPAKAEAAPPKAAAAPKAAEAGHASASGSEAKPAADKKSADPMVALREKLAEKLGATKPPEAKHQNIVRVASKAEAHGAAHAAPAMRPKAPAVGTEMQQLVDEHRKAKAGDSHAGHAHVHWSYAGEGGPQAWGTLKPDFAKCSTGTRQSPIDIRGGVPVDLEPVQFDYKPVGFSVVDNGHTVQVNVGGGNAIQVMGRRYDLLQFHFHRPSEERINGRQFDMVAHLVHKDVEGRLAVVAVLLDRGSAHPLVQHVWNNLPLEKGEETPASKPLDLNELLPADRRYYTYMGSLTTPPCSEGVLWMVMQQPVNLSPQQIEIFSRLYPMNARPIQQAAGRLIKQSN